MSHKYILIGFASTILIVASAVTRAESPATRLHLKQVAQIVPGPAGSTIDSLRCAYIGYRGSFHLTGQNGTAAYWLGNQPYITELSYTRTDQSFYYYKPTNGDPFITEWAFGFQPDCGRYWVWFRDRGGWRRYELTRAWGTRPPEFTTSTPDASLKALRATVNQHERRIKTLEDQLNAAPAQR